jgi:hypothetical protein
MKHSLKQLAALALTLVVIGGGCIGARLKDAPAEAPPNDDEAAVMREKSPSDEAADAYLAESEAEQAAAKEEEQDVSALSATDAELNAFGQTYDQSEF